MLVFHIKLNAKTLLHTQYSSDDFCQINSSISNANSISVLEVNISVCKRIGQTVSNFYANVVITLETSEGIDGLELINATVDACKFFINPGYETNIPSLLHRSDVN